MDFGLALGGLGALAGGLGSFFGGKQQADAYGKAAQMALDASAPWRNAGASALPIIQREIGQGFQESPGYQYVLDQALRGANRGANAQGLYGSGARANALTRTAAGLASQEYGNWYNRLAGLAGLGQTATQSAMPVISQATQGQGSAAGAATAGLGNAVQGFGNNLLTMYAMGMGPWGKGG